MKCILDYFELMWQILYDLCPISPIPCTKQIKLQVLLLSLLISKYIKVIVENMKNTRKDSWIVFYMTST